MASQRSLPHWFFLPLKKLGPLCATNPFYLNGWNAGWTFPGSQQISQMWNATYTQSGASVTATSMSYNGTLAAGASTTFGFIATGSSAAPGSITCT